MNPKILETIAWEFGIHGEYETIRINTKPALCNLYVYGGKRNINFLLKQIRNK